MSDANLKARWRAGAPLVGFFTRLKDSTAYEILAKSATDFIIVDAEHGSFDRPRLADCLFAGRAHGLPMLVRVPDEREAAIQHAIGEGADGIIVPHASSAEVIAGIVEFVRIRALERAYAGATRISSYRRETWPGFHAREAGRVLVIAQIDEPPGIAAAQDIVSVAGLDGVFLGQIGLTLAMGSEASASEAALDGVCRAAVSSNLPIGLSLTDEKKAVASHGRGVTLFTIDSDHNLLKSAADARANLFRSNIGQPALGELNDEEGHHLPFRCCPTAPRQGPGSRTQTLGWTVANYVRASPWMSYVARGVGRLAIPGNLVTIFRNRGCPKAHPDRQARQEHLSRGTGDFRQPNGRNSSWGRLDEFAAMQHVFPLDPRICG